MLLQGSVLRFQKLSCATGQLFQLACMRMTKWPHESGDTDALICVLQDRSQHDLSSHALQRMTERIATVL